MSEPKQHHYIPNKFQLRFGDAEGRWWFFNRLLPERGVQRGTPGALFSKNRLYSVTDAEGRRSAAFETETSKIEGRANLLVERIVAAARAGRTPGLAAAERRTWDRYFLLQWRRVPDIHRRSTMYSGAEDEVRASLAEAWALFPGQRDEILRMSSPSEVARLAQNAKVEALSGEMDPVLAVLSGRGLAVVRITDPRRSFILGSLPVVKLNWPGRAHLRDLEVEMWLPVASDVMVGVGQLPGTEMLIPTGDAAMIRAINEAILRQSAMIAGRSQALIRSLAANSPAWAQVANGDAG